MTTTTRARARTRGQTVVLPDVALATITAVLPLGRLADRIRAVRTTLGADVHLDLGEYTDIEVALRRATIAPHPIVRQRAACYALSMLRQAADGLGSDACWPVPVRVWDPPVDGVLPDTTWLPRAVSTSSREH